MPTFEKPDRDVVVAVDPAGRSATVPSVCIDVFADFDFVDFADSVPVAFLFVPFVDFAAFGMMTMTMPLTLADACVFILLVCGA